MRFPTTDEDHAENIRFQLRQLQGDIQRAAEAGLHVDVDATLQVEVTSGLRLPVISIAISRPL